MKRKEMYERITKILDEDDQYIKAAECLDYRLCSHAGSDEINVNDVYDIVATECFGGSEGIYVDLYAYSVSQKMNIITFKTLYDDKSSWMTMGQIAAMASWAAHKAEWD